MKEFKSRMYLLYELKDSLPEGIKRNKELLKIEKDFIKVINNSGKKEKFEFITKDFENEMVQLEKSIKAMEKRLPLLEELIELYEKHDENSKLVDYVLSLFMDSTGIVPEEEPAKEEPSVKN